MGAQLTLRPLAEQENIVKGDVWRFTVLTDRLIRMEYDEEGAFYDGVTQTVLRRDFPRVDFQVFRGKEGIVIETKALRLVYAGGRFGPGSLKVLVKDSLDNEGNIWYFGNLPQRPLGGTARTLDRVDGACDLGNGLFSQDGYGILDDSHTLGLKEGKVLPRCRMGQGALPRWIDQGAGANDSCKDVSTQTDAFEDTPGEIPVDLYFFGYDKDYLQGLKDFYYLTGPTPLLPRFALGNWWSRWYAYSEKSYLELMDRFRAERVPFAVAVMDMDWHLVDIDPKYGVGWTGYTWNRELFPNPSGFLGELHRRGLRAALNIHPADGIRGYEDCYQDMAKAMGVDAACEEKIEFDVADPLFWEAYFKYVNHPMEEGGVDFWWLDWQQGTTSRMEGLDPLWMLNFKYFEDAQRNDKRPLIFSRYAGIGSHRYPIGFSGDTYVTWDSLDFQPYFNATAANIGYGWWSNDIGGHMHGIKNDELYGRWVQLGVFSPILRLHSTKNEFNGREPWRFSPEVCRMTEKFLRLRHQLIPYLYTMNERAAGEGIPLCVPMYYFYPRNKEAYEVKNQYLFGSELLCAPITHKEKPGEPGASVNVWLPEGLWFDFFTGMPYRGGRMIRMYRKIESFPVLAKAGGIIPMSGEIFDGAFLRNPKTLVLRVYPGDDGSFDLYEDDNETTAYQRGSCVHTPITFCWNGDKSLAVGAAQGETGLIPEVRSWTVEIPAVKKTSVFLKKGEEQIRLETEYEEETSTLRFSVAECRASEGFFVYFPEGLTIDEELPRRILYDFLDRAEMEYDLKLALYGKIREAGSPAFVISQLPALVREEGLCYALMELLGN